MKNNTEPIIKYLPPYLQASKGRNQLSLKFGIRAVDSTGQRIALQDYELPKKGMLVWKMCMGETDDLGIPTGVGMTLSAFLLKTGITYSDRLRDEDVVPYLMPHGEHLVFSDDSCIKWMRDDRVGQRVRIGDDGIDWNFLALYDAYKSWIRMIYLVSVVSLSARCPC